MASSIAHSGPEVGSEIKESDEMALDPLAETPESSDVVETEVQPPQAPIAPGSLAPQPAMTGAVDAPIVLTDSDIKEVPGQRQQYRALG